MKIVGIVAEYNPFHKGHAYQINKIRELLGENTCIVCVMSGDFVQRGEPALFSKFARAEAAVRCGADLVLELPIQCSVASAERFASGAVQILGRLGAVDYLVFGSESENIEAIKLTARALSGPEFDALIQEKLAEGCSYPTARSAALQVLVGCDVVSAPNDNLGVEYVRAIEKFGYPMKPIAIKRIGAGHDEFRDSEIKSGSEIRSIAKEGRMFADFVPQEAYWVYEREMKMGCGPIYTDSIEQAVLSRLRFLPLSAYQDLPDAAEGLENKLFKASRTCGSLCRIYDTVKSKRYAHARIRRMVMCAALGITKADYEWDHLYARVLALNSRGAKVLRESDGVRSIEVVSKPATARCLPAEAFSSFEKSARAHDLYVLGYSDSDYRVGDADWKTSPIFIR